MNLLVLMDGRFRWHNDTPLSSHMSYATFGSRFAASFESTTIHARAYTGSSVGLPVTGPGVSFNRLPSYNGLMQFVLFSPVIIYKIFQLAVSRNAILFYLPGTLPIICALFRLIFTRHPIYALVVADPYDQLSSHSGSPITSRFARLIFTNLLKYILARSKCSMYVTKTYLQSKYPPAPNSVTFGTSDVSISDDYFHPQSRNYEREDLRPLRMVCVGMMSHSYKGHASVIEAVAYMKENLDKQVMVTLVGDGVLRPKLEELCKALGVEDQVLFVGARKRDHDLEQYLDDAHLFILLSKAEGLPRAVVEAMARALPVVATDVGGMRELIDMRYLVPVGDVAAAGVLISKLTKQELNEMSRQNIQTARQYRKKFIDKDIREFYSSISDSWGNYK